MAASTANRNNLAQVAMARVQRLVETSNTIYSGTLVCVNAAGYLVPASDTSALVFDGYAETYTVGTSPLTPGATTDRTQSVLVTPRAGGKLGLVEIDAVSPLQSWIGQQIAAADDHTGQLTVTSAHDVRLGRCVAVTVTGATGRIVVDTHDLGNFVVAGS